MPTWDATADMEEGNLSDFDGGTAGGVSATAASKFNGSYGMSTVLSSDDAYGVQSAAVVSETKVIHEFYFDPNSWGTSTGQTFTMDLIYNGGSAYVCAAAQCRKDAGGLYSVRVLGYNDAGSSTAGSWYSISDNWHILRVLFRRATGAGQNNGVAYLYEGYAVASSVTGLDSDTRQAEEVYTGAFTGGVALSGTVYYDDVKVADESEHTAVFYGAASSIVGGYTKAATKYFTGGLSSIVGTFTKEATKYFTGDISSIVGSILYYKYVELTGAISSITGSIQVTFSRIMARIIATLAPAMAIAGITAPAADVSGETAPEGAVEES